MTDTPKVVAFLPTGSAPNVLATARAAAAIAAAAGGTAVAMLPAGVECDGIDRSGVGRVIRIEGITGSATNGDAMSAAFIAAIEAVSLEVGQALVLLPFGAVEEEAAAAIAVALGGTAMGKCSTIELSSKGCTVERPVYGGRATARLHAEYGPFVCIARPSLAMGSDKPGATAAEETVSVAVASNAPKVEQIMHDGPRHPPLESAKIIVSGGRGMGGAENFAVLERIASAIGGVVSCSLPAADAGWYPVSRQVGQSGKFISPDLYIAVGISGMSQHMAGIAENVPIFAINNDPDSSIWEIAEVGVLDDWRNVLPLLLAALSS
jgi:electron transfer flavoprotein alpha subunit